MHHFVNFTSTLFHKHDFEIMSCYKRWLKMCKSHAVYCRISMLYKISFLMRQSQSDVIYNVMGCDMKRINRGTDSTSSQKSQAAARSEVSGEE